MDLVFYSLKKTINFRFAPTGLSSLLLVGACCFYPGNSRGAAATTDPSDPLIATYDGGSVTLHKLEEFMREMPVGQRIPYAKSAKAWRVEMAGELAKSVELTSQSKLLGMHMDPSYLRARDYFINEYMCFLVFRDELTNRMDISLDAQNKYYETHKADFWLSPTVSLRAIRTRSQDKLTSAMAQLKSGVPFEKVEMEFSEVSPRYRGRVVGPFPSFEDRTMIPPPDEVIEAALATPEGQTTGPLKVGSNYFLTQTVAKTEGRQQTLEEVAEKVEEGLRAAENTVFLPQLIDRIQKELGVEVDEALFNSSSPKSDDLLATIGATRIYRQEYTDLNGNVRGPAAPIARMMPSKLKGFVLPYMISEWAKLNHHLEREETQKAIYYYDLQHLAAKMAFEVGDQISPPPNDDELRKFFQDHIKEYRVKGKPEPRFEDYKDQISDSLIQKRMPEVDQMVRSVVLQKIHFKMEPSPQSSNITALEALAISGDRLPQDARLLEMGPATIPTDSTGTTPYSEIGRAPAWRITYTSPKGGVSEVIINGPAPLIQSEDDYTSVGAFHKWEDLWRFDTDALKRHAVDKSFGDFMAKYGFKVRAAATVEFSYSKDDPTSPTDCMIVYSATPADDSIQDGILLRYSASEGDITKRRLGEQIGKCPTCPAPDLPASAILNSATSATTTPTSTGKGDN